MSLIDGAGGFTPIAGQDRTRVLRNVNGVSMSYTIEINAITQQGQKEKSGGSMSTTFRAAFSSVAEASPSARRSATSTAARSSLGIWPACARVTPPRLRVSCSPRRRS